MNRQKVRSLCIKNPAIFGKKITFLISFPQEASSHRVDGSIVQYGWFCVGLHHSTPPNSIWARRYTSSKTDGRVRSQTPPRSRAEVKACSVKGDFGENRGISVQKVVQKVMYWELGLEKWSRTGSILMIYENSICILKFYFFEKMFYRNKNYVSIKHFEISIFQKKNLKILIFKWLQVNQINKDRNSDNSRLNCLKWEST